ncbi:hypothetical protein J6590_106398 [Homalodisca vitripennis]|nr:hypothetical protein J6590_106398 [Homalodisca vitripennis]
MYICDARIRSQLFIQTDCIRCLSIQEHVLHPRLSDTRRLLNKSHIARCHSVRTQYPQYMYICDTRVRSQLFIQTDCISCLSIQEHVLLSRLSDTRRLFNKSHIAGCHSVRTQYPQCMYICDIRDYSQLLIQTDCTNCLSIQEHVLLPRLSDTRRLQ